MRKKLIITILDEFIEETPKKSNTSARGSLAKYANTALWEEEETAWEKAAGEKYATDYSNQRPESMDIYENTMSRLSMYQDIEISEAQITFGEVKDARAALRETRAKYGI